MKKDINNIFVFIKQLINRKIKFKHFIFFILCIPSLVVAQTTKEKIKILQKTNVTNLQKLQTKLQKRQINYKKEAEKIAKIKGWELTKTNEHGNFMELMRVGSNGNPMYFTTNNLGAAKTTKTNTLWTGGSLGLNLNGEGITLGIWDAGAIDLQHQEWQNNISILDDSANDSRLQPHSTHVAGTMVAQGIVPEAKGMANKANLNSYDWVNGIVELTSAVTNGLLLSNHSYGWYGGDLFLQEFGRYDQWAQSWDEIMFNAPYSLAVKAAGNDQESDYNPTKNGYDLINGASCAKNALVVAAVEKVENYTSSSSVVMSNFSSWGPTDDGRIKPDISAKGVDVYSTIITGGAFEYASFDGTSMAAPNVTGSLGLLQQHYNNNFNNYMKAATLKAIVLATADETGEALGPDYKFGWGLLNVEKAALAISEQGVTTIIEELSLNNQSTYTTTINTSGVSSLTIAIAWTDKKGVLVNGVDNRQPMLINDLDVRVFKDGTTFMPWKLDPVNPSNAATKGDNIVDNIERININNAPAGSYTIVVSHKESLIGENQDFSLIVIGGTTNTPVCQTTIPSSLRMDEIDDMSAIFSWDRISLTSAYEYRYRKTGTSTWTTDSSEINSVYLTGLVPSTDYEIQIRTNCPNTNSSYSSSLTFRTLDLCEDTAPTDIVVAPKVNMMYGSEFYLEMDHLISWNEVEAVRKYNVRYKEVGTSEWTNLLVNGISTRIIGMAFDTEYEVQVNSVCNNGSVSAYSPSFYFNTAIACENNLAQNVHTTSISETEVTISWNEQGILPLVIVLFDPDTHERRVKKIYTNSITFTGLTSGTNYIITIRTVCWISHPDEVVAFHFTTLGLRPCPITTVTGFLASDFIENGATISWEEVPAAIKYNYEYTVGDDNWISGSTIDNSLTLTDLPLEYHTIKVSAECAEDVSPYTSFIFRIPQVGELCGDYPPQNIQATNIDINSAIINWDGIPEAFLYKVKYKPENSNAFLEEETFVSTLTLNGLLPSTNYEVLIGAECLSGGYIEGQFNFTTTGATSCFVVPAALTASEVALNEANLNWDAVSEATSYNYRYRVSGSDWIIQSNNNTSVALVGLNSNTTYQAQVSAVCLEGTSPYSDTISFTTISCTVTTPNNLSVSGITSNEANINWSTISGATSYNYRYRISGGNWITNATNTASTVINGLNPETMYEFQVNAICADETSPYSDSINFTTNVCSVTIPTGLLVSSFSHNAALINWNAVENATSYNARYRKLGDSSWRVKTYEEEPTGTLIGLTSETTYEVQIKAKCSSDVSSNYSSSVNFTTQGITGPTSCHLPAENFNTVSVEANTAILRWDPIDNGILTPTLYQVKYKKAGSWYRYRVASLTEITLTGLEANTSYEVKLKAYCSGPSPFAELSFTTQVTNGAGAGSFGSSSSSEYLVYPNPNKGNFTIDFTKDNQIIQSVTIYDMMGKKVFYKNYNRKLNAEQYSLKSVENGLYKIIIKTESNVEYKTLLIK